MGHINCCLSVKNRAVGTLYHPYVAMKGCSHREMILCYGVAIGIESNNLRTLHSGNSSPWQFRAIFNVKKQLELLPMDLEQYLIMSDISFAMGMFLYQN